MVGTVKKVCARSAQTFNSITHRPTRYGSHFEKVLRLIYEAEHFFTAAYRQTFWVSRASRIWHSCNFAVRKVANTNKRQHQKCDGKWIVFSRIETPEPCTFVRISPGTSHRSVRSWHKEICFAHQCDPQNKLHIAARLRSMDRSEE